ncbi:MAG: HEPN domain-containing protein [Chloroflexi bacterium]|nr:HEPN domain-containing protein [Chloroflexota bacterium]
MNARSETGYRLSLAERFVAQPARAFEYEDWHSCVRSSRDAVENAAKSVIACFGPVEKSHDPDKQLEHLLSKKAIAPVLERDIKELVRLSEPMGFKKHIQIRYGDEEAFIDPWQLFDRNSASEALETAKKSVQIAGKVYDFYTRPHDSGKPRDR